MTYAMTETPIGTLMLSAEGGAVTGVRFASDALVPETWEDDAADREVLLRLTEQLGEYFNGERRSFDVPISFDSAHSPKISPFRRRVWEALRTVPYGETVTYGGLAAMAGNGRACRAAGSACGANPMLLLVPCHRVVAADGIGGFAGRLEVKRMLLTLEGARAEKRNKQK